MRSADGTRAPHSTKDLLPGRISEDVEQCAGELLEEFPILIPLKRRLAAAPLPAVNEDRIERACAHVTLVHELFYWLLGVQDIVPRVRAEFDAASLAEDAPLFGSG